MTDIASDAQQLVVFSLGEEEYALPIERVQEILFFTPPRPVASGEAWVTGVISLRGKIIAVYDLAARLGVGGDRHEQAKIVIVESGAERAGIIVDDVAEVLTIATADLEPLPAATENDLLEAIAKVGDRLIATLNLNALVTGGVPAYDAALDSAPASVPVAA